VYRILNYNNQVDPSSLPQIIHVMRYDEDKSNKKQHSFISTIGLRNPVLANES